MTGCILLQAIYPALNDFHVGFTSMVDAQARVRVRLDTSDRGYVRVGLSTSFMANNITHTRKITVTDQK